MQASNKIALSKYSVHAFSTDFHRKKFFIRKTNPTLEKKYQVLLKVLYESIVQGLHQLTANKLRTFLSLLGITIGIFSIVSVQSAIDSMKVSVKNSFNELGSDVVYIDRNPWDETNDDNFRIYEKFPEPNYKEYLELEERLDLAKYISYCGFSNGSVIKYQNSSIEGAFIMGPSFDYASVQNIKFKAGRWFTNNEYNTASNKLILGATLADELFQDINPVGKYVRLYGSKYQVIGVVEENGDNLFSPIPYDIASIIPLTNLKNYININDDRNGRIVSAKANDGVTLDELKDEIIADLRAIRQIRPIEQNNFFVNNISMLDGIINDVFGKMTIVGYIIGIFALIVGLFSVANIMFVSVKERTNLIGIKKALGAKRAVILLEILTEAVILCIVGGFMGIFMVLGVLKVIAVVSSFAVGLTFWNGVYGVVISVITGILAGLAPALTASKMDPVEAMRA